MEKVGYAIDNIGVLTRNDPLASIDWLSETPHLSGLHIDYDSLNAAKDKVWCERYRIDPEMGADEFWARVFEEARVALGRNGTGQRRLFERIDMALIDRHEPNEDMIRYVRELHYDPRVVTALYTNVSRPMLYEFDRMMGLSDIFDHVTASCLEGAPKHSPGVVQKTLRKLRDAGSIRIGVADDQERNVKAMVDGGADLGVLHRYEQTRATIDKLEELRKGT